MLTILLNPNRSEPLYQQICAAIREEIASGALQPNEKLPSRRTLSAHLQISIVTVQTAYEQLAAEGYLYSRSRAGYYVDPDAPLLAHMPKERVLSEVQLVQAVPEDQIVFSTSGVDLEQFPFSTWAKLSRQVLSTKQETLLQSPPAMGLYELRAAIAAHLRAFRDIHAAPEQILVGAGTEYLLGILVQLLGASRRYAVEEPGYFKGKRILRSNGVSVIDILNGQKRVGHYGAATFGCNSRSCDTVAPVPYRNHYAGAAACGIAGVGQRWEYPVFDRGRL